MRTPAGHVSIKDTAMPHVATVQCPICRARTRCEMPEASCVYLWECPACFSLLRPKPGDCCVFCSYGDQVCPPKAGS